MSTSGKKSTFPGSMRGKYSHGPAATVRHYENTLEAGQLKGHTELLSDRVRGKLCKTAPQMGGCLKWLLPADQDQENAKAKMDPLLPDAERYNHTQASHRPMPECFTNNEPAVVQHLTGPRVRCKDCHVRCEAVHPR